MADEYAYKRPLEVSRFFERRLEDWDSHSCIKFEHFPKINLRIKSNNSVAAFVKNNKLKSYQISRIIRVKLKRMGKIRTSHLIR